MLVLLECVIGFAVVALVLILCIQWTGSVFFGFALWALAMNFALLVFFAVKGARER